MSVQQVVIRADDADGALSVTTLETAGFESLAGVHERVNAAVAALGALFPQAGTIDIRVVRHERWLSNGR